MYEYLVSASVTQQPLKWDELRTGEVFVVRSPIKGVDFHHLMVKVDKNTARPLGRAYAKRVNFTRLLAPNQNLEMFHPVVENEMLG